MKRVMLMAAAAAFLIATPSCKKGENDPFLSLSSRKARLAGEWTVSGYETKTTSSSDGDMDTNTEKFDGTNVTSTWTSVDDGTTTSGTGSAVITIGKYDFTIEKDGTWTSEMNRTEVETDDFAGATVTTTTQSTTMDAGTWSFLKKNKGNYKNKERVQLSTTSSTKTSQATTVTAVGGTSTTTTGAEVKTTNTYKINQVAVVYDIDMLKGKEMVWKMDADATNNTSVTDDGTTVSSTSGSTYVGEMTFTHK